MALRKKKTLLDQAQEYVEAVRPHVESAVSTTRDAVEDFVENTARPALSDGWDKAQPVIADARDRAATGFADAREKAGPAVADARAKAGPAIKDARAKAAPVVADVAARASEAASQARDAADARVASLRGEEPPKKGGKLKKIALFAAVAGVVGFVAKKLQGGKSTDNWQSSYVPRPAPAAAPAPASTPAAAPTVVKDAGGSAPDEALSDAAEGTKPVTTPDEPAEVVDLEDTAKKPAPKKS